MSAATQADGHDEGHEELHQSGWVYFVTYAACLGFLSLLMFAKGLYFSSLAILVAALLSIPAQIFLADCKWFHYAGSILPFAALMAFGGAYVTAIAIGVGTLLSIPTFQLLDRGQWWMSAMMMVVTIGAIYGTTYIPI